MSSAVLVAVVSGWVSGRASGWATELVRLTVDVEPDRADIKPGWVALVIVLLLIGATILLWLNMRKQLDRIEFTEKDTPRRRDGEPPPA